MTTFNTDYSNTELLDQELTIEQLEAVAGGGGTPWVGQDTGFGARQGTPTEFYGSGGGGTR